MWLRLVEGRRGLRVKVSLLICYTKPISLRISGNALNQMCLEHGTQAQYERHPSLGQ